MRGFVPFREAMNKAGYDPDRVMIDPWSMGKSSTSHTSGDLLALEAVESVVVCVCRPDLCVM